MQHRRDTVMAVGLGEAAAKALEVGRDLAGNAFEAHPDDSQAKLPAHPGGETIRRSDAWAVSKGAASFTFHEVYLSR